MSAFGVESTAALGTWGRRLWVEAVCKRYAGDGHW